jgi:hypothetical protein
MKAKIQALSKKQLAHRLKISSDTLITWIEPIRYKLEEYGYRKSVKIMTPRIVEIILDFVDAKDNLDADQDAENSKS